MARRYTPNQLEYRKQIKRIRKALSTLRKQGYDVSQLAEKYTLDLPNRVTQKMLRELRETKPKDLKQQAQFVGYYPKKGTPLSVSPETYAQEPVTYLPTLPPSSLQLEPEIETLFETAIEQPEEPIDLTPDYTGEPIELPFYEDEGETYEETPDTEEIEETDDEEPSIQVIETDTEVLYVDGETGEIIDRVTRMDTEPLDLSEQAIEYLRDLARRFNPTFEQQINNVIDQMITEKGMQAVADAFTETINERPSLLQLLASPQEHYNAMRAIISDICERLDIDDKSREIFRDIATRESMSDMERYGV